MRTVLQKGVYEGPEEDFLWWFNEHCKRDIKDVVSIVHIANKIVVYYRCVVPEGWVCKRPGDF
jgi:hypothetical protein